MKQLEALNFENIYDSLPPIFFSKHKPEKLTNQYLVHFNQKVSELLGIDPNEANRRDFIDLLTGVSPDLALDPFAMCYAGHQFGQYVPRLGDGRAIIVGQMMTPEGKKWDLQLKGAGRTLYSRQGDGKAVLRSTIREHLCSAAMDGLGIPTTHSLAMFGSQEEVCREQVETGAMLIRVAPSHIRFGSFEYFFYSNRHDDLKTLADFTIQHYFPHLQEQQNPYLSLLSEVIATTATMIAGWQSVGFCHGVMNSDNMSIHGITIDYGPFGFLDGYNPKHICNHSDHQGRYAFDQQPSIGLFNLSCLAQALLPLLHENPDTGVELATDALNKYQALFNSVMLQKSRNKLGLLTQQDGDDQLYNDLLTMMQPNAADFTLVFRTLSEQGTTACRDQFADREQYDQWTSRYQQRLKQESEGQSQDQRESLMLKSNPKYILRNYMAEQAICQAQDEKDYSEIETLITLLQTPYDEQPNMAQYAALPPDWSASLSVSCSS